MKSYIPDKGDIVWINLDPQLGREIKKRRPALVLSPLQYNKHGLAIFCPITSKVKGYPFEVIIEEKTIKGAILSDHIKNFDWTEREIKFITSVSKDKLYQVLERISLLLR